MVNFPFHLRSEAVESFSVFSTLVLCGVVLYGYYRFARGDISPAKYNLRIQVFAVTIFLPFISYFVLRILWLKENNAFWSFDMDFMQAQAGWEISNDWPFETKIQDLRWKMYRVGVFNSLRVVFVSIICSTILGIIIGVSRLSRNKLLSSLARIYVDLFRNMPLLVQLFFVSLWFLTTLEPMSEIQQNNFYEWIFWSNRGIIFPKIEIGSLFLFNIGISTLLIFRIYTRLSERYFLDDYIEETQFYSRPFLRLGKRAEPVAVDALFSLSIILILYGLTNIVRWNYDFSFDKGVIELEPFSIFVIGCLMIYLSSFFTSNLEKDGLNNFTEDFSEKAIKKRMQLTALIIVITLIFIFMSLYIEKPNLITEENGQELSWGSWIFEDGTYENVSSLFLTLMIGLTLYTAAQISEVVRGSIQALPIGQIEAAISVGLSPYQRLKLIILPQALRSMIPSLTNQYLNCWKNSSLAFLIGFSDFYRILDNIVNNAGHAVAIFALILITYQAGSLTISAIMNSINKSVTKVKI